jgi:hypothetical protein
VKLHTIDSYDLCKLASYLLDMTFRGTPWNKGKHWPKEIKDKISASMKGRKRPPFSEEWRRHISEQHRKLECNKGLIAWNKGKTGIYSKERLRQMREFMKGKRYGAANKGRISERRGKTGIYTIETIRKMSEAANRRWSKESERKKQSIAKQGCIPWMKGRHHTEESKRKMSETKRNKRHGYQKTNA